MSAAVAIPQDGRLNRIGRIGYDLWCLSRAAGPKAALSTAGELARNRFYVRYDEQILVKDLAVEPEPVTSKVAVRVIPGEPEHLPLLKVINRGKCKSEQAHGFAKSLAGGAKVLLGFAGDELIGYFWWVDSTHATGARKLTRFGVDLSGDEVYGYDFYIDPKHRGGGTATAFLAGVEAELARLGYRRMIGCVETGNKPARWLYITNGFDLVCHTQTRILLRRIALVDGRAYLLGERGARPLTKAVVAGQRG